MTLLCRGRLKLLVLSLTAGVLLTWLYLLAGNLESGRSLLLAPCPAGSPERAALESRVLEAEEENRRIRLQLGRLQAGAGRPPDGNDGNQQWGASADTGPDDGDTAEDRNHTDCPRSAPGVRCELGSPPHLQSVSSWLLMAPHGSSPSLGALGTEILVRYFRLDQMMFSWEKQNTPSRPPRMLVSMITSVSATSLEPSKNRALVEAGGETSQCPTFLGSFHRRRTWSGVSPVCQREFLRYSPGPVLDFTTWW
ncbi:Glycosyltransferase-like protein LARGE2 [Liparis tanakae]|uniref:Glycosyltransferase-like protein LARGE2 n=1 Tax=Liparis tanakae TaxID=230148 RepID=A0A4Z2FE25_9TELE|nr:Glycosyltransferase-like protein LARGE2 [Liparis tanakae]